MIKAFKARIGAVEAIVKFDKPITDSLKFICEMDRNELRVLMSDGSKGIIKQKKAMLYINNTYGNNTRRASNSDVSHEEAWEKLQDYIEKSVFKFPVIEKIST